MDQGAGAVGVGNLGPGIVSESTGGALTLQASVDRHGGDPTGQTPVYVHSAPGPLPLLPGLPDRRHGPDLVPRPVRRARRSRARPREGRDAYDLLTELAAAVPAGLRRADHAAPPRRAPSAPSTSRSARGVFYGFTLAPRQGPTSSGRCSRRWRSCSGATWSCSRARAPRRPRSARTAAAPGAPLWNQIKADVCGLPVVTLEGEDAAVRGDAMLAGVAPRASSATSTRPGGRWSPVEARYRARPGRPAPPTTAAYGRYVAAVRGAPTAVRATGHPRRSRPR